MDGFALEQEKWEATKSLLLNYLGYYEGDKVPKKTLMFVNDWMDYFSKRMSAVEAAKAIQKAMVELR